MSEPVGGVGTYAMNTKLLAENRLILRPLTPEDIDQVRILCTDCFPIDYPETWLQYVTSGQVMLLQLQ